MGKKASSNPPPPQPQTMPPNTYKYGDPLYHGTSRDIEGAILPNKVHGQGRANTPTKGLEKGPRRTDDRLAYDEWLRENKAYATENEDYAWKTFAHRTADLNYDPDRPGGNRGRVYELEPQPDITPGVWGQELTADRFPIKGRIDIKPGHQGTLPIDWRQFAPRGAITPGRSGSDAFYNHPSPLRQLWATQAIARREAPLGPEPREEIPGQMGLWGEDVPQWRPLSSHQFLPPPAR